MIDWKTTKTEIPESGNRVAIKLPDGRICSGLVTKTRGINLEYIDNIDLISYMLSDNQEWIELDENSKQHKQLCVHPFKDLIFIRDRQIKCKCGKYFSY